MPLDHEAVCAIHLHQLRDAVLGLPICIQQQVLRGVGQIHSLVVRVDLRSTADESCVCTESACFLECIAGVALNPLLKSAK